MEERNYRFLRLKEMRQLLGLSRSRIEAMVREGILPKPYRLGKRAVGWRSDEVEKAMANFSRIDSAYAESGRKSVEKEIIIRRTK